MAALQQLTVERDTGTCGGNGPLCVRSSISIIHKQNIVELLLESFSSNLFSERRFGVKYVTSRSDNLIDYVGQLSTAESRIYQSHRLQLIFVFRNSCIYIYNAFRIHKRQVTFIDILARNGWTIFGDVRGAWGAEHIEDECLCEQKKVFATIYYDENRVDLIAPRTLLNYCPK